MPVIQNDENNYYLSDFLRTVSDLGSAYINARYKPDTQYIAVPATNTAVPAGLPTNQVNTPSGGVVENWLTKDVMIVGALIGGGLLIALLAK